MMGEARLWVGKADGATWEGSQLAKHEGEGRIEDRDH